MILVDTSVWIELLGRSGRFVLKKEELLEVATCPPVVQEVLQGVKNDIVHQRLDVSAALYLEASDLFRFARRRGITVRSSVDCLIASIAIRSNIAVWHFDRDFEALTATPG